MANPPPLQQKKSAFKEEFTMNTYPPEKAGQPGSQSLPSRSTGASEDAVPDFDPTDTAGILLERLQAWKHACGDFEDYITATEKMQKSHAKEYEKVLKPISNPLREGHHFDQSLGGIAGLFESMRSNTQAIADSHLETAKGISKTVLPILTGLRSEIKSKSKDISNGPAKISKEVANARNTTQRYLELLGQHAATYDAAGGKIDPHHDPYVLQRAIQHRLYRQIQMENENRQELLNVQDDFLKFEAHIIQTIQRALGEFLKYTSTQADRQKALYADMVGTGHRIPPEFEWTNFRHRSGNFLVDPATPARTLSNISYPNESHAATKPSIEGILERKSRGMGAFAGYKSGYYTVTPSKYLHQFEDSDNFKKDPTPELSLYLPDCIVGAVSGEKFNIKGKDVTKGKVSGAFSMSHEFAFKAHTSGDAHKWHSVIQGAIGTGSSEVMSSASPTSGNALGSQPPTEKQEKQAPAVQTQNLPAAQTPASAGPAAVAADSTSPQNAEAERPAVATSPAGPQ